MTPTEAEIANAENHSSSCRKRHHNLYVAARDTLDEFEDAKPSKGATEALKLALDESKEYFYPQRS